MKTICFVIAMFFSISGFSQKLAVTDVLAMIGMTYDDFDSYVIEKGYKFHSADSTMGLKSFIYQTKNFDYGLARIASNTKTYEIHYYSYNEKDYLDTKKELKSLGYQFEKQTNDGEASTIVYTLNGHSISLTSQRLKNSSTISYQLKVR